MTAIDRKTKDRAMKMLQEGKSPKEVADKLGLPRTTVANWKGKAQPAEQEPGAPSALPPTSATTAEGSTVEPEPPAPGPTAELAQGSRSSAPTRPANGAPMAIYVRNTLDLQRLRLVPRIKALAEGAGLHEAQIARSLLLLGLAQAEKDPGVLVKAAGMAREGQGEAA